MSNLILDIKKKQNTFSIKMDRNKFETLAASFGMFNSDFLDSIDQSEKDYKVGKTKKVKSLQELK